MGVEIERKFLLKEGKWPIAPENTGTYILQGYLANDEAKVVRVRIYGEKGFLTVKSRVTGMSRQEFEFEIPVSEAREMLLSLCRSLIEKVRYKIIAGGKLWEIDVFSGENEGLIVAELELTSESEEFLRPDWIGEEVTDDLRYYNSNLALQPFRRWEQSDIF